MDIVLKMELAQTLVNCVKYDEVGNRKHHVVGAIYINNSAFENEKGGMPTEIQVTIESIN
jgi:hypothetical protein